MKVETAIARYRDNMRQIKYRTAVISKCIDTYVAGGSVTGYRETDIELCYLQFRKILELIMFSAVTAHSAFAIKLSKHLQDKEFSASKILRQIQRINPKYYPEPVKDLGYPDGIRKVDKISHGYLTESDFCTLYDKICGKYLHASRQNVYFGCIESHFEKIMDYHKKTVRLLNHHWIHISDKIALAVLMQTQSDGDVQVTHMQSIKLKTEVHARTK